MAVTLQRKKWSIRVADYLEQSVSFALARNRNPTEKMEEPRTNVDLTPPPTSGDVEQQQEEFGADKLPYPTEQQPTSRRKFVIGTVAVIAAIAVIIAVAAGKAAAPAKKNDNDTTALSFLQEVDDGTGVPSDQPSDVPTESPVEAPTPTSPEPPVAPVEPTAPIVPSPVAAPLVAAPVVPTPGLLVAPAPVAPSPLVSAEDLRWAIDDYVENGMNSQAAAAYGPIGEWDVSRVQDFSEAFSAKRNGAMASFNEDLKDWDTAMATTMRAMFQDASDFNGRVSFWNVDRVKDMAMMFQGATRFDSGVSRSHGDLTGWHVDRVSDMTSMFEGASAFNRRMQNWDVSQVVSAKDMFRHATSFSQDIEIWELFKATDVSGMFYGASSFGEMPGLDRMGLCKWTYLFASPPADMTDMFVGTACEDTTDPDISRRGGHFCINDCDFPDPDTGT